MDGGTAGKVQGAELQEPASTTEYPVGHRVVHESGPQEDEDEEGAELGPLGEGAGDEGGGDDGEHGLEDHEGFMGYGRGVGVGGLHAHVLEPKPG